eukprot:Em0028g59a
MPSRNRKKRYKQRAEYLQKQEDILSQENKAKARARYKADPEKKASVRDSYKADPEKKKASKKASVRDSYKADPEKKKASVRDSYKADPEKKKASLQGRSRIEEGLCTRQLQGRSRIEEGLCTRQLQGRSRKEGLCSRQLHADIESKQSANRQRYQEDLEENRAAKRQRYQEDVEENRAAKRQKYEDNSAAIKASERNRYWNDPAVRLAKRAAERKRYRRGHRTTLYHPKQLGAIPVDLSGRCVVAEEIGDRDKDTMHPLKWKYAELPPLLSTASSSRAAPTATSSSNTAAPLPAAEAAVAALPPLLPAEAAGAPLLAPAPPPAPVLAPVPPPPLRLLPPWLLPPPPAWLSWPEPGCQGKCNDSAFFSSLLYDSFSFGRYKTENIYHMSMHLFQHLQESELACKEDGSDSDSSTLTNESHHLAIDLQPEATPPPKARHWHTLHQTQQTRWLVAAQPSPAVRRTHRQTATDTTDEERGKRHQRRHCSTHVHSYPQVLASPFISCVPTPDKREIRKIQKGQVGQAAWMEAWNMFSATRIQTAPQTALKLVKYQNIICQLFTAYATRQQQPSTSSKQAHHHTSRYYSTIWRCPQQVVPTTWSEPGQEICRQFNLGRCNKGAECYSVHKCWVTGCGGEHSGKACPLHCTSGPVSSSELTPLYDAHLEHELRLQPDEAWVCITCPLPCPFPTHSGNGLGEGDTSIYLQQAHFCHQQLRLVPPEA